MNSRASWMVLGGEGTNDIPFYYGFWLFISVELFHLFGRTKLNTKHNTQKNRYLDNMLEDYVWYFAYGSNLYMPQMFSRVGEWRTSRKAFLRGWKLVFNVQSRHWGGKTANIIQIKNTEDIVCGAIYQITIQKLSVLTEYEHKEPEVIEVES